MGIPFLGRRLGRAARMAASAAALVLMAMTALGLHEFSQTTERVKRADLVIDSLQRLRLTLVDAETGQRGYILTGKDDYLAVYRDGRLGFVGELTVLKHLVEQDGVPTGWGRYNALSSLGFDKLDELASTVSLRASEGFEAAQRVVMTDLGKTLMDGFRRTSSDWLLVEQGAIENYEKAASAFAFWTMICLVASLVSIVMWLLLLLAGDG